MLLEYFNLSALKMTEKITVFNVRSRKPVPRGLFETAQPNFPKDRKGT
jgi:hypothetical protein